MAEIERLGGPVADHRTPGEIHRVRRWIDGVGSGEVVASMHEFIDRVQAAINTVGDCLQADYFPRREAA